MFQFSFYKVYKGITLEFFNKSDIVLNYTFLFYSDHQKSSFASEAFISNYTVLKNMEGIPTLRANSWEITDRGI